MTEEQIASKIRSLYPGSEVEITDTTGTKDHFYVSVKAQQFSGLSRIKQHQAILDLFREEFKTGEVHAFEIKTQVKEQA